jgi:hypothetical protein
MKFKRQGQDGTEEEVECETPVMRMDANQLGLDQLESTGSVFVYGFGSSGTGQPGAQIVPRGGVPDDAAPTEFVNGQPHIIATINGKDCPPVKIPESPDSLVQQGKFPGIIDSGASYTTIGKRTAAKLKECAGVRVTGTIPVRTSEGITNCEVLEGVEITFELANGESVTCRRKVVVFGTLAIGTDQLEHLKLVVVVDPKRRRSGVWPVKDAPIDPWGNGGRPAGGATPPLVGPPPPPPPWWRRGPGPWLPDPGEGTGR